MSENDKIIDKIRNLLELAEDGNGDEESHTALLMAQKLMLKHKISQHEISEVAPNQIVVKSLSIYKRVFWWEKMLARVIADNFRVMFYLQSNKLPHQQTIQRKIVFMGYTEDVELAYEMFHIAAQHMKHFASAHLIDSDTHAVQNGIRKLYYQGFIDGLSEKFEKQRAELQAEDEQFALVIRTPQEVKEAFDKQVNGHIVFKQPPTNKETEAYQDGYLKGSKLILTTKLIDEQS